MPSEQPTTRVDRCPTCGHDREVVTGDEGTSYFKPPSEQPREGETRVDLAERLEHERKIALHNCNARVDDPINEAYERGKLKAYGHARDLAIRASIDINDAETLIDQQAADLREAASTLSTYEQARVSADDLAALKVHASVVYHGHESETYAKVPTDLFRRAVAALEGSNDE